MHNNMFHQHLARQKYSSYSPLCSRPSYQALHFLAQPTASQSLGHSLHHLISSPPPLDSQSLPLLLRLLRPPSVLRSRTPCIVGPTALNHSDEDIDTLLRKINQDSFQSGVNGAITSRKRCPERREQAKVERKSSHSVGFEPLKPLQTHISIAESEEKPAQSYTSTNDPKERRIPIHCEENWNLHFKELLLFIKENGHANVPYKYEKNQALAVWVKRQRRCYKKRMDGEDTVMTKNRLKALESVGFVWDSHELNWRNKMNALREFKRKHGHCNVAEQYNERELHVWVKCQRRQYKLYCAGKPSAMFPERIQKLEGMGFQWEIRQRKSTSSKCIKLLERRR